MDMTKIEVLLVEDNKEDCKNFVEIASTTSDIEIVAMTDSAKQGIELVKECQPNAVILDLELHEGDGVDFLFRLKDLNPKHRPYVVVTTNTVDEVTLQTMRANGAGFIFTKHILGYGPQQVFTLLRRMKRYMHCYDPGYVRDLQKLYSLDETEKNRLASRLGYELEQMCMTPNLSGYHYLIDSVIYAYMYPNKMPEVTGEIYPYVANRNGTKPTNIEHSIRSAIENAWRRMGGVMTNYYADAIQPTKGRPTNKEMIAFLVNMLRNESLEQQTKKEPPKADTRKKSPEKKNGKKPPKADAPEEKSTKEPPEADTPEELPKEKSGKELLEADTPEEKSGKEPPEADTPEELPEEKSTKEPPEADAPEEPSEEKNGKEPPEADTPEELPEERSTKEPLEADTPEEPSKELMEIK